MAGKKVRDLAPITGAAVPVLPDPVPRDGERALARWGLLGEGAGPVFTPGTLYPLAGLLLALPALEATGLRELFVVAPDLDTALHG